MSAAPASSPASSASQRSADAATAARLDGASSLARSEFQSCRASSVRKDATPRRSRASTASSHGTVAASSARQAPTCRSRRSAHVAGTTAADGAAMATAAISVNWFSARPASSRAPRSKDSSQASHPARSAGMAAVMAASRRAASDDPCSIARPSVSASPWITQGPIVGRSIFSFRPLFKVKRQARKLPLSTVETYRGGSGWSVWVSYQL